MATTGRNPQDMSEETETKARSKNVGTADRVISAVVGGGMMALGLWRVTRSPWRLAIALAGSPLLERALSGRSAIYRALGLSSNKRAEGERRGVSTERSKYVQSAVTINAEPARIYQFWHQFENLPRFMLHLESVSRLEGGGWHWVAKAPLGKTVEWDAEVTQDITDRLIAWRSRPGSEIANEGTVEFAAAPGGRGTEVRVRLMYEPPAGKLGVLVAKLFGEEPQQQVDEDLRRLKSLIETGEIPTIAGQSSGRAKESRDEKKSGERTTHHVGEPPAPTPTVSAEDPNGAKSEPAAAKSPAGQVPKTMFTGASAPAHAPVVPPVSRTGVGLAPPPVVPAAPRTTASIPTSDPATERMRKETAQERKEDLKEREDFESDQSFPASDPPARY